MPATDTYLSCRYPGKMPPELSCGRLTNALYAGINKRSQRVYLRSALASRSAIVSNLTQDNAMGPNRDQVC